MEERIYCVYMHRNKLNNKVYIGQTRQDLSKRWRDGEGYKSSTHFYAAIQKYGWDNFEHIILQDKLTSLEADYFESQYILEYDATNDKRGYNLRTGGKNNFSLNSAAIERHLSSLRRGENHFNSKKVRCIQTGDIFPSIESAKMWCNSTKVGECCRGNRKNAGFHPITGESLSWEYADKEAKVTINCMEKVKPLQSKKFLEVICINTGKTFNSAREAAEWCGLKDASNINRCCGGERASAGKHPITKEKLKWKYKGA